MKRNFWVKKLPAASLVALILLITVAFQNKPASTKQKFTDTLPDRSKKVKDIDQAIEELERSKAEVDRSLKDIDFSKVEKELKAARENMQIDAVKMKAEMEALKQVDMARMKADIESSLQEIDAAKMKAEIDKAMNNVDLEKIKADVQASVAKIDWDKMNAELKKAESVDFEKIETDLKKVKPNIEKSMKAAHESIEKAKEELHAYKNLIDGLDRDGLINKKEDYTIEYKNDALIINGKEQPTEVINKYQQFLQGRKNFTIRKNADDFDINKN